MGQILRLLREDAPYEVVHLASDLGFRGVADEDWFGRLDPNEQWVILTHDLQIKKRPQELAAWREQGHIVFFLAKGWSLTTFNERVSMLVRWWPTIVNTAENAQRGDGFQIPFRSTPRKLEKLKINPPRKKPKKNK